MKTIITLEIEHTKDIPHLAEMVAGRAWNIGGVTSAEVAGEAERVDLAAMGFTPGEIALGRTEVERG